MNVATKIAALIAPLAEARPVTYTIQGEDGQISFTAPTPEAAGRMMLELHSMAAFQPVSADYEGGLRTGEVAEVPALFAHVLPARGVRAGFGGVE